MNYFSETYHESTQYAPRSNGDPVALHWENQSVPDFRYVGRKRYPVTSSHSVLHSPFFADGLSSVAVFAVLNGADKPNGVYYCDSENSEMVELGTKTLADSIVGAFPEKEFLRESQYLYIYCGVMSKNVWRYREAAYRQVEIDVGAACANTMLYEKSVGRKVFALGAFVDDAVAVALNLPSTVIPLAAVAVFPENSMVAFNFEDDGFGEFSYSNRGEEPVVTGDSQMVESCLRYPSRFMLQNRCECINDLSKCVKVRRVSSSALPGDEFPLTPAKFANDYFMREIWFLAERCKTVSPFSVVTVDLDDFSTTLRNLEMIPISAFGAGLLKIWIVVFDVMFVYSGVYRYIPIRKSIYMHASDVLQKKFSKCFAVPEEVQGTSFAVLFSADLNEACSILGERAYRYLNMNAGCLAAQLDVSCRMLNRTARMEHFYFEADLKKVCGIPENETIFTTIAVGKVK